MVGVEADLWRGQAGVIPIKGTVRFGLYPAQMEKNFLMGANAT